MIIWTRQKPPCCAMRCAWWTGTIRVLGCDPLCSHVFIVTVIFSPHYIGNVTCCGALVKARITFIFHLCRRAIECPPARHSQNRSKSDRLLLVLRSLLPVVAAHAGHVPAAHHGAAVEDHHPLAPLLVEEDRVVRVIDLGDGSVRVKAEEGAKVFEGHVTGSGVLRED